DQGVAAESRLVLGKGWREIVRQVLRGGHDLVVVGTRDVTGLRRLLFGNTALKLFRRCPCPGWVTKPGHTSRPVNVLIAADLKPSGEQALRIGVPLGRVLGGAIHVLNVVEYPLDSLWGTADLDVDTVAYHRRIRDDAERKLRDQLAAADPEGAGA